MSENNRTQEQTILDLDSIATKVTEMGATPFWGSLLILIATEKGFGNGPQKVKLIKLDNDIFVVVGDCEQGKELDINYFNAFERKMSYVSYRSGVAFVIPNDNEKETDVNNAIKLVYNQRLKCAGLSDEVAAMILDKLFNSAELNKPNVLSGFVVTKSDKTINVVYGHGIEPVASTHTEGSIRTTEGDDVAYRIGRESAFFIVDNANSEEALIKKHCGTVELTVKLGGNHPQHLPFTVKAQKHRDGIRVKLDASLEFYLKDGGKLHNSDGPAYTPADRSIEPSYYLNGFKFSKAEYDTRTIPGSSTWDDIK